MFAEAVRESGLSLAQGANSFVSRILIPKSLDLRIQEGNPANPMIPNGGEGVGCPSNRMVNRRVPKPGKPEGRRAADNQARLRRPLLRTENRELRTGRCWGMTSPAQVQAGARSPSPLMPAKASLTTRQCLRMSLVYRMGETIAVEDLFVSVFAVDGFIQTNFFRHLADLHRGEGIDNPEHCISEDERPDRREGNGDNLLQQEDRIAVEQSVRSVRIELLVGEDSQHDDAKKAAHAVNSPNIERVIPVQPVLHFDRVVANHASNQSDDHRGGGGKRTRPQESRSPIRQPLRSASRGTSASFR